MDEKIIEQPVLEAEETLNFEEENAKQTDSENLNGSIYGKFKDAKNLLEAYNSLQGEFTRKSQKLAEIQKKYDEIAAFSKQEEGLGDILSAESDSDKYKKEIEEMLAKKENISSLPNKYRVAFEMIKETESRLAESLNSQEFYDKYISKNDEIKNKIISEYLSKLNNISAPPKILSGNSSRVYFCPSEKPKTVKEAGEIFSKMLK